MSWRNRLEQLIGLVEKVPRPRSFKSKTGVYQPYFVIELRANNWELIPYAAYTRLDNSPGREVRLTLAIVDSSKVNITQGELDCLLFLESDSSHNSRSIFSYTQAIGFLLEWLTESELYVKEAAHKTPYKVTVHPAMGTIIMRLKRSKKGYYLQPSLLFNNQDILEIEKPAVVLSSNPIFLLYNKKLYKVTSALPAIFWNNYFRIQEYFEIPYAELKDFVRIYLPHLLPVLDWNNLGEKIQEKELPLSERFIIFSEINNHLQIDVIFKYGKYEFPAYPAAERSLASEGKTLQIVQRDVQTEERLRKVLEENGLIFSSGNWHIAADYHYLDWMRQVIPRLIKAGFTIIGEEKLTRYRVYRQTPRLEIKVRSQTDWLDLKYRLMIGKHAVKIPDLPGQIQNGKEYLKLADGSHVYLPEQLRSQLKSLTNFLDMKTGQGEIHLSRAGISLLLALQNLDAQLRLDKESAGLIDKYQKFRNIQPVTPPASFNGSLREYQQHGLNWLFFLKDFRFGGILADDMGLGKTVQVISLLLKLKEENALPHPALIVVPLTLIFNWSEEFQKFSPQLRVLRYHGNRNERKQLLESIQEYDAVLCSYGVVLQDARQLSEKQFAYIILDESQKIKNPQTKTYKAVRKLKAPHKLALTGTPVENTLTDLWAQMNFVNPGLLGTLKQFTDRYVEIAEEERREKIAALKKIIYPFILRRTKEEVEKQLPPLTQIVQYVEMPEKQRQVYRDSLAYYREEIFHQIDREGMSKSRIKIVEALTYLRQIACHPAILKEGMELWDSGKMLLLQDMLEDLLGKGHKILIFSQFVRFLKLVRQMFDANAWRYEYLDGTVKNRSERIHNFQENPEISAFLISLKAGGLGLNLTAADYVIHLDPWWNPAVERQATDRAHRIGQDKRVFVYKYIVKDTVEEKILTLQERKKALSKELITSDTGFVKSLTREDLEILFAKIQEK